MAIVRESSAIIRDVMPAFELFQPTSIEEALSVLAQYGTDAWVLAGGIDSFDWLKDRIKRPKAVVDLGRIRELRGVRELAGGGVEIRAMTTLTDVVLHPAIRKSFKLLADAAESAASPQIRNQGTIGGNVSQDTRCWYYRSGFPCYRAGGNICYADTPYGMNREHAILGAARCVAVSPSDSAPAMVALEAKMLVRNSNGERAVNAEDYFIGPGFDITRMTVLKQGDILTAIRIPSAWANASFYFEKISDRPVWDFPIVNIAAAKVISGGKIRRIRLVVNGVAAHPWRLRQVEEAVTGQPADEQTGARAGELAIADAVPLQHNGFKLPLMRNLVKRAICATPA
ncbi:MAG TPA: xanthine dehydrogenase family protein subunit M [Candidatus Dormibacteraeota bacterium]|nr:xanthine dehydrogenase family protein subunit M [Candidatus Dormibacteraeota bacterium]